MATVDMRGFTIIELMLFLGVTGALFAALMVGVNTNIAQQQYKSSVLSYSTLLQDQYSQVTNPLNDRGDDIGCSNGDIEKNTPTARGTTSCVILGRAVQVMDDGSTIQTATVIGTDQPAQDTNTSDIQAITDYDPKLSSTDSETTKMDWGSTLSTTDGRSSVASFLILRSPVSGLIRVFASNTALPAKLSDAITQSAATSTVTNCVNGFTGSLPVQSVTVNPNVAGPDAITVKGLDPSCG